MRADKDNFKESPKINARQTIIFSVIAVLVIVCALAGAFMAGVILFPYVPPATPTPTPIVVYITPTPPAIINGSNTTATPTPGPTSMPTAYPTLSPTVTPDRDDAESISILDPVDYDRVITPDTSVSPGRLTITGSSYYGQAYAYRGDTFRMRLNYQAINHVNQVRVRFSTVSLDGNHTLADINRVEYWRLEPGESISRNYGFHISDDPAIQPPSGTYVIRLNIYNYNQSTGAFDDFCAGLVRKLTVL